MPPITLNNRYKYNPDTDLLGTGGLGAVYKAYDVQQERYVAIKKFNAADSLRYSLKAEFQKSIHFSHGNLVRAYDFFSTNYTLPTGETHETQYGVMELITGGDLAKYLKTKPPLPELLEVVKGILRGLAYLHTPDPNTDKGIVIHRDIKPANILIFRNNQGKPIPKITDFNIAKDASNEPTTQNVVGTPNYMSPEQILPTKYGTKGRVMPNTDLWALGVLLCDHLLNQSVFNGLSFTEITHNVLNHPLPIASIQTLPAPFNQMIAQCLVRDAQQRIQSAKELLKLIDSKNWVEEDTEVPPPEKEPLPPTYVPDPEEPAKPTPPKNNTPEITIGVIVLCFLLGLGYWFYLTGGVGKPSIKMISIPGRSYRLSETEVTIGQYLAFCKATNSHYPQWLEQGSEYNIHTGSNDFYKEIGMNESKTNYPITGVSATDADAFCRWMGGRLPTEQEWEYAAKGGQSYEYAGSDNINEVAWYDDNSRNKAHPVKQKRANGYGLYDMSGNVWEWTSSTKGSYRVLRGGSWNYLAVYCRVEHRYFYTPGHRNNYRGFRLVFAP